METAPAGLKPENEVSTDFKQLIALQIKRSEKRQRAYNRFMGLLGLAIVFFLFMYFDYLFGIIHFLF